MRTVCSVWDVPCLGDGNLKYVGGRYGEEEIIVEFDVIVALRGGVLWEGGGGDVIMI